MIRTTSAHLFLATEKDGSFQGVQNVAGIGRLLAAVMEALCHPAVKLTAIMPINCEPETEAVLRRQSLCAGCEEAGGTSTLGRYTTGKAEGNHCRTGVWSSARWRSITQL